MRVSIIAGHHCGGAIRIIIRVGNRLGEWAAWWVQEEARGSGEHRIKAVYEAQLAAVLQRLRCCLRPHAAE